jgi:putative transposase
MAAARRCIEMPVIVHSDQGSTYASRDYQGLLSHHGMLSSMSRKALFKRSGAGTRVFLEFVVMTDRLAIFA